MSSDASKVLARADRLLLAPLAGRRAAFKLAVDSSNNAAATRGGYQSGPHYKTLRALCEGELAARVELLLTSAEAAHQAMDGPVDESAQREAKEWFSANLRKHADELEQVLKAHPASLKNAIKRQSLTDPARVHVESGYARIDQFFDSARRSDRKHLINAGKRLLAMLGRWLHFRS